MEESGEALHHDEDGESEERPEAERHVQLDGADVVVVLQTERQHHVPQYFRQFWKLLYNISIFGHLYDYCKY